MSETGRRHPASARAGIGGERRARVLPRVLLTVSSLLACGVAGCGASEGRGGAVTFRYAPAVGSTIRYAVVARSVPGDVPGRTVSAVAGLRTIAEGERGAHRLSLDVEAVHLAGEGGSAVAARGEVHVAHALGPRHELVGAPSVDGGDVAGADDVVRAALGDALAFPERPVGVGEAWDAGPVEQVVLNEVPVSIAREARLESVEGGVATVALSGSGEASVERSGARVAIRGALEGRARIRVADGLLVERDTTTTVTLTATRADGAAIGERLHRTRTHVARITGVAPEPEAHDWRPDRVESTCEARLRAMGRRFEHAPRIDVGPATSSGIALLQAADGRDIDEAGPVIAGDDREAMGRALAAADLGRAVVLYVAASRDADDATVAAWLAEVPAFIEVRRLVRRPVDPPAPRPSEVIAGLRGDAAAAALVPSLALCEAATEAFEEHGVTPAARPAILEGLARCGCDVTALADLEALLDRTLGGPDLGWIPLRRE